MANLIDDAKRSIDLLLEDAYKKATAAGELPEGGLSGGKVEIPKDTANGDYAANHAMAGAKALKLPPRKIAEALVKNIDLADSFFQSAEIAGPGFINFSLSNKWYTSVIKTVTSEGSRYGRSDGLNGKKIMVEFVSANPTGPMHMGNARGGVLGDSLAAVLACNGAEVWREFYVNDTGNQIEKFAVSLEARYIQLIKGEDAAPFPEDGYHGDDIRELAKLFYEEHGDSYLNRPERERRDALSRFGLDHNLPKMKSDLERYKIFYDRWFYESSLYESGEVDETMKLLDEKGVLYEKDGAIWLKTAEILTNVYKKAGKSDKDIEKLDLKDDVLRRANGFYTYFASDIAYHRNKLESRGFDTVINVWGADHHGHVARLKGSMDALDLDGENRLDVVLMQLVKLMREGEVVRMSKRTGKAISLSDLLDEVPVDAARWFFNTKPDTQMDFDLDLAIRQDSENPVYYVQYAHARICSLLSAMAAEGCTVESAEKLNLELLTEPQERELIKQLAQYTDEIRLAARDYDPSRVNRYVTELAARFHRFYNACRIKDAEKSLQGARLLLCECTRSVIENALSIIGVTAPEKM